MTPLEDRIREALHASADLSVSRLDVEAAEARFQSRSRPAASAGRPRADLVAVAVAVLIAAALVWWLARPGVDQLAPTNQPGPSLSTDDRVGIIGPPPFGTPPTGPATGELVAAAELYS